MPDLQDGVMTEAQRRHIRHLLALVDHHRLRMCVGFWRDGITSVSRPEYWRAVISGSPGPAHNDRRRIRWQTTWPP